MTFHQAEGDVRPLRDLFTSRSFNSHFDAGVVLRNRSSRGGDFLVAARRLCCLGTAGRDTKKKKVRLAGQRRLIEFKRAETALRLCGPTVGKKLRALSLVTWGTATYHRTWITLGWNWRTIAHDCRWDYRTDLNNAIYEIQELKPLGSSCIVFCTHFLFLTYLTHSSHLCFFFISINDKHVFAFSP